MMNKLTVLFLLGPLFFGCSREPDVIEFKSVDEEARYFMQAYSNTLNEGNKQKIATFYSNKGATMVFNGAEEKRSLTQIKALYQGAWQAPDQFEWCNLSFIKQSDDKLLVTGFFNWQTKDATEQFTYEAHLARENNALKVTFEKESIRAEGEVDNSCIDTLKH